MDESNVNALPDLASVRAHIVKAEWFWTSVQNEGAADEKEYLFEDVSQSHFPRPEPKRPGVSQGRKGPKSKLELAFRPSLVAGTRRRRRLNSVAHVW